MVRLKYVIRNGVLCLRISENKSRYYKRVTHLLIGNPNIKKHFNKDKGCFTAYAVRYKENNQVLKEYKSIFQNLVNENPSLTAKQVSSHYNQYHKDEFEESYKDEFQESVTNYWKPDEFRNSVSKYLDVVIERERAKTGCNFEVYEKLSKKCRKIIPNFDRLRFDEIDYNKMVGIAYIFSGHRGYRNTGKSFRSLLGKADVDRDVDFSLTQIGNFSFSDYDPRKNDIVNKKPDILSDEQLRIFLNANPDDLTPQYHDRFAVRLYYDFCVFMFHSFFAPCDVIKLKVTDITKRNTLHIKRKKTHRAVEVPINPSMREIINRYKGISKEGYVFPIQNDKLQAQYKTKDYFFKNFREKLNLWLKNIGDLLGTDFPMYAYVFRHTAITVAANNSVPISYIAETAGTSIEMIQKHYYNGQSQQNKEKLMRAFMAAAV